MHAILFTVHLPTITQLVLIDLPAAFDTVNHCILSTVMQNQYGVSSTALEWIESYLTGRYQQVSIGSSLSDKFSLNHGVPQGSCLDPVMFTNTLVPFSMLSVSTRRKPMVTQMITKSIKAFLSLL